MRCPKPLLILALFITCAGKLCIAQEHAPVKITRLYTGEDGMSHFEQVNVKCSPVPGAPKTVEESEHVSTKKIYVVKAVVEKFRQKYGAGDVKKYYSKFDVAVAANVANS